MKNILVLLIILNVYSYALSQEVKVDYFNNFGLIKGFSQIPKGGQYNTTSDKEPTFEQLGINRINYSKFLLELSGEKWGTYLEIKNNQFKGRSILNKKIKTHDRELFPGTKVESKHKYNFYNIGLKYEIYKNKNFKIIPKLEFSIFDFKYSFSAKNEDRNINIFNDTRSFKAGGIRMGGNVEYLISDKLILTTNIMTYVPCGSIKKSLETNLVLSQNIFKKDNKEVNLLYGIGYDFFEYKDSQQDMQNHMKNKIAPIFIGGIEYKI